MIVSAAGAHALDPHRGATGAHADQDRLA